MNLRRNFLKTSALGAAATATAFALPPELWAKSFGPIGANNRIRIGLIGCKGMGFSDLSSLMRLPEMEVAALCDVDRSVLDQRIAEITAAGRPKPAAYTDYRKLLERKDVDVVVIGTPDHWHCLQLLDALDAGKDVYCEKPIANSIEECDRMLAAVNQSDRMVQIGQWQRSQPHFREAIAFVHSGALGPIRLAKTWAYQGWMEPVPVMPNGPAPDGVDYGMWLGPAPLREFNPNRFHFNFRWFWDYAGGLMTDWGVHLIDYALFGMQATNPKTVMASGGKFAYADDASETPDTLQTVYEFEGFNLLWEHATGIDGGNYGRNHGIAFIGNNGTLVLDRGGWEVIPEEEFRGWGEKGVPKMEAVSLQTAQGSGLDLHTANFIEAVRNRTPEILNAPIEIGFNAAKVSHMGNIAYKCGRKLTWDANRGRFEDEEAHRLTRAKYHNGWELK